MIEGNESVIHRCNTEDSFSSFWVNRTRCLDDWILAGRLVRRHFFRFGSAIVNRNQIFRELMGLDQRSSGIGR